MLLSGCTGLTGRTTVPTVLLEAPSPEPAWAVLATPPDRDRLDRLAQAWRTALPATRSSTLARLARREGALLAPDAALAYPMPPPGRYYCRSISFGGSGGRRSHVAGVRRNCFVGGDVPLPSLTQQGGPSRPGGYFHPDTATRLVFLGAVATGREPLPPPYADVPDRDVAGIVERIGDFRYRLVIPWRGNMPLQVIELVPAL